MKFFISLFWCVTAFAQKKGAAVIPMAQMPDGTIVAASAQSLEQIQQLLWAALSGLAIFLLKDIYYSIKGKGENNSQQLAELQAAYAAAIASARQREEAVKEDISEIKEVLSDIKNNMITRDEVRVIAEDRIAYAERFKGR